MNIKGLNIYEITHLLKPYLINHFKDCKVSNADESLFTESYLFDYEEILHIIPPEYRLRFNKTDKFNGASGFIEFDDMSKRFKDKEYTALLLVNEDYSRALFFAVKEIDEHNESSEIIIIKNFLKGGE